MVKDSFLDSEFISYVDAVDPVDSGSSRGCSHETYPHEALATSQSICVAINASTQSHEA